MKPLPANYDHKEAEKRWQHSWEERKVYAWDESQPRSNTYVIDTPPPTVSGLLHMGHVFSYTQADFVARYQRMAGKTVFYPMGFDDNGLPTERLVEKVKKVRATDMSREDFIALCEGVSEEARKEFRALFESIALSVDWAQEYHTISKDSRTISQMSFLDLFEKERAYRKLLPMHWDPIDQTAIAQAEVEDKEMPSQKNYINFGIMDKEKFKRHFPLPSWNELEKIEIMTTRPELLGACVAVMCHPDDEERYKGKVAITPVFGVAVPIIADPKVNKEKGTGLVMCCTFGDETDISWWREHGLKTRVILNKFGKIEVGVLDQGGYDDGICFLGCDGSNSLDEGNTNDIKKTIAAFKQLMPDGKGMKCRTDARAKMLELLAADGAIYKEPEVGVHAEPCAERSGSPLEYLITHQWFVKILDQKEELKAKAAECNWHPEFMRIRMNQWIDGLSWDWCISRQRYFGVPFPVWYSKRAGEEGRIITADADQLPVNPLVDLPRGYSREEVEAEADVMDTWATSSVSPQLSSRGINGTGSLSRPSRGRVREGAGEAAQPLAVQWKTSKELVENARELRKKSTDVENIIWSIVRREQVRGYKFRRQHPLEKYVLDFVCLEAKLVIELDGGQHAEQKSYDQERTKFLEKKGFAVLRFWNNEVLENLEGVVETLWSALPFTDSSSPLPNPPPQEAGEGTSPYLVDAQRHAKLFPADLRPQAHEIIRTWAFYTIVKAHLHEDTIPWKNLMISGWCLASDKTKMSKSKGNVVTPVEMIEEKGSDVVRFWASTSRLGADTAYSEDVLKIGKKLVTKLWNATKFAAIHLDKLERKPGTAKADADNGIITEPLDLWILTRLNKAIKKSTQAFDKYEYCDARVATEDFFWNDFCDNYLELVKVRVYGETATAARASAVHTIYHCLDGILRLFAPIVPHITEELYAHIFDEKLVELGGSIHARGTWLKAADYPVCEQSEAAGAACVSVLNAVRKAKAERNVSIKWPLTFIAVSGEKAEAVMGALSSDLKNVTSAAGVFFADKPAKEGQGRTVDADNGFKVTVEFAEASDAA